MIDCLRWDPLSDFHLLSRTVDFLRRVRRVDGVKGAGGPDSESQNLVQGLGFGV
jgi:hypothetical protein